MLNQSLSKASASQPPLLRLLHHLTPQRRLVTVASICSVLNRLFDLAPPVLVGVAIDVVGWRRFKAAC